MSKFAHNVIENALSYNDDERSIVHIITDETINRYGQIVRMDGIDTAGYNKNPVVFFNHRSDELPIGRSMWLKKEIKNGVKSMIAKTQFHDSEQAMTVFNMWKDGFLNASSIGFVVNEVKPVLNDKGQFEAVEFVKTDLGEYSIVGVPANKNAVRNAVEKYGNSGWIINSIIEESEKEVEFLDKIVSLQTELNSLKTEFEIIKNGNVIEEVRNSVKEIKDKVEKLMVENVARERKEKLNKLISDINGGAFSR